MTDPLCGTSRRFYNQVKYRTNPYIRTRIYIHEKPSFVIYLDIYFYFSLLDASIDKWHTEITLIYEDYEYAST
jgi:hypothetical protein